MKVFFFVAFVLCLLVSACGNDAGKRAPQKKAPAGVVVPQTARSLEPSIFNADRVQFIYYDDPEGDSLRYSRFFTFAETTDSIVIRVLLQQLDQPFAQEAKARDCRSEGKLYLLKGEDVLKTIYFSARALPCSYFYFIKDGNFQYGPLSAEANSLLLNFRKKAIRPKAGAPEPVS